MNYTIQLVSLDLEHISPSPTHTTETGRWHDKYEGTFWYDGSSVKDCAEVAIEHAEKAITELKEHIKKLKKIK